MIRPLRIAIALPGLHRVNRGAETAFERIGHELGRIGHDVTMFGSGQAMPDSPYRFRHIDCQPREKFESWPTFPPLRSNYAWEELTFAPGLLRAYRPADFDIALACSYPFTNWILRRGNGRRPKHIFVTQNGDWMAQAQNAEYRLFNCDGLVCTNPQYFQRHRNHYRSALIPNGVNPGIFHPGPGNHAAFGLPSDRPIVLIVSALIESKRVAEAMSAAAKIPEVFVVVAGNGECRDAVDQLGATELRGRFKRLILPRERMPDLYRCARVFVHASRDEPSANVYLEALATGLPVVTPDLEVTRWTLQDTGVLVDVNQTGAMTEGIRQALCMNTESDVSRRLQLVRDRFTWTALVGQYDQFFSGLLAE